MKLFLGPIKFISCGIFPIILTLQATHEPQEEGAIPHHIEGLLGGKINSSVFIEG